MLKTDSPDESRSPEFAVSYSAYNVALEASKLQAAIAACDNPVTLQEVAYDLQDAYERISERLVEVQTRVSHLQFARPLIEVA